MNNPGLRVLGPRPGRRGSPAVPKTAGAIERRRGGRGADAPAEEDLKISTIIVTRNGLSEVPSESMPARTRGPGSPFDEDVADPRRPAKGDLARQSGGQLGQPQGQGRH